jgi:hypothetical protein
MESTQFIDNFNRLIGRSYLFAETVEKGIGRLPDKTERQRISSLLVRAALSHYRAIPLLLADDIYLISALALARSVMDASFRAIWTAQIATDDELSAVLNNPRKWPGPPIVARRLEIKLNQKLTLPNEIDVIQQMWGKLSGFAHSGPVELQSMRGITHQTRLDKLRASIVTSSSLFLNYGACLTATAVKAVAIARHIDGEFEALNTLGEALIQEPNVTVH